MELRDGGAERVRASESLGDLGNVAEVGERRDFQ